jgi:hypothetical protein
MPKKKHPSKMTNDELVRHLFHPKIVEWGCDSGVMEAEEGHVYPVTLVIL